MTSSGRSVALAALAAALAGTACGSTATGSRASTPSRARVASSPAATAEPVDSTARRVLASFKVGAKIGPIAVGAGWVWATNTNGTVVGQGSNGTTPNLVRIDPATNRVTATVDLPTNPRLVVVSGGMVYVALAGRLLAVDASTLRIAGDYAVAGDPTAMVATPSALWIAEGYGEGTVVRFDVATRHVDATVHITSSNTADQAMHGDPSDLVAANGALWAMMDVEGKVARIDPSSATVTALYPLPSGQTGLMSPAPDGSIWISTDDGHLVHFDTRTGASHVLGTEVPDSSYLVARAGVLWVVGGGDKLYHVDIAADRVVETVGFGTGEVADMADDGTALWIASLADTLAHIDTR